MEESEEVQVQYLPHVNGAVLVCSPGLMEAILLGSANYSLTRKDDETAEQDERVEAEVMLITVQAVLKSFASVVEVARRSGVYHGDPDDFVLEVKGDGEDPGPLEERPEDFSDRLDLGDLRRMLGKG